MFYACPARQHAYMLLCACLALCFCAFASGCFGEDDPPGETQKNTGQKAPVKIVYVDWASEKASSHVIKTVIENRFNRECKHLPVTLIAMWQSLAAGDQDCTTAAWLPLHNDYYKQHRSEVDNLGPNLEGTRLGLVVPEYVDIDSIDELNAHAEKFDHKIIGIDPHAGIMEKTAKAFEQYNLEDFQLVSGSAPTMTAALKKAISQKKWIAVTGWTPHWKFARWDLKYIDDPEGVYGEKNHIATIARKGLQQDMPEVYAFLDNFHWTPAEMSAVMAMARDENTTYAEAAERWVRTHQDRVDAWINTD
ncbi:MAG: glycine betaine ABC transporter substrate-binding protein [Thermodesulfobacteriota bacterium]